MEVYEFLNHLGLLFAWIAGLAVFGELVVEWAQPVLNKLNNYDPAWKKSACMTLVALAAGLSTFAAKSTITSFVPELPEIPAWISYVIIGVLASAGSQPWHSLLQLIEKLQQKMPRRV